MCNRPAQCQAVKEHTGDYVCNRCGLYWDAGDEAPECLTDLEVLHNRQRTLLKSNREHGRSVLAKLKEDLNK